MVLKKKKLLIILFIAFWSTFLYSKECIEPNYDNEIIQELNLNKFRLRDGIITYLNKYDKMLYPAEELFELFDIKFNSKSHYFQTPVFTNDTKLLIDYDKNILEINSTKQSFEKYVDDERIACYEDILYIDIDLLSKLINSEVEYKQQYLRTTIKSKRLFPIDIKLIKQKLSENFGQQKRRTHIPKDWFGKLKMRYLETDSYEKIDNKEWFSLYLLSLRLSKTSKADSGKITLNTNSRILDHDVFFVLNKAEKRESTINFYATKTITDNDVIPYISRYKVGDVGVGTIRGAVKSLGGRGVTLTNKANKSSSESYIDLDGILQKGWFAELYTSGRLIAYAEATDDNQYFFYDVKLHNGENVFKFIFYGPQGEIEEKEEVYYVNSTFKNQNKLRYEAEFVQDKNDKEIQMSHISVNYGISQYVDSRLDFWKFKGKNEKDNNNSITTDFLGVYFSAEPINWLKIQYQDAFYKDNKKMKMNYFDISLNIPLYIISNINIGKTTYHNDFKMLNSDDIEYDSSEFETDILIPMTRNKINFRRKIEKRKNTDFIMDKYRTSLRFNGKTNMSINVSNYLNTKVQSINTNISYRNGEKSHRFSLDASRNSKRTTINTMGYNNTFKVSKKMKLTSGLRYSYGTKKISLNSSLSYKNKQYTTGFNLSRSGSGDYYFGASLQTNILRYKKSIYDFKMIKNINSRRGIAIIDVFLVDEDHNILQKIDNCMIGFGSRSVDLKDEKYSKTDTNATIIDGIDTYEELDVNLIENSLQDISWKLLSKPIRMTFYPGKVERFTFYAIQTGEIDGVVSLEDNGTVRDLGNVNIILTDILGDEVARTQTESDGYYMFQQVEPGMYNIKIDEEDFEKLNTKTFEPIELRIGNKQLFYFDQNILLKRK